MASSRGRIFNSRRCFSASESYSNKVHANQDLNVSLTCSEIAGILQDRVEKVGVTGSARVHDNLSQTGMKMRT